MATYRKIGIVSRHEGRYLYIQTLNSIPEPVVLHHTVGGVSQEAYSVLSLEQEYDESLTPPWIMKCYLKSAGTQLSSGDEISVEISSSPTYPDTIKDTDVQPLITDTDDLTVTDDTELSAIEAYQRPHEQIRLVTTHSGTEYYYKYIYDDYATYAVAPSWDEAIKPDDSNGLGYSATGVFGNGWWVRILGFGSTPFTPGTTDKVSATPTDVFPGTLSEKIVDPLKTTGVVNQYMYLDYDSSTLEVNGSGELAVKGVVGAEEDNIATLDANGLPQDGGRSMADIRQEKTGWQRDIKSVLSLSFDDGARKLTVTPTGTVSYWIQDVEYEISSPQDVTITDTEGMWYFYFDASGLHATQTDWDYADNDKAYIAYLWWNATNKVHVGLGWNCHMWPMSAHTRDLMHDVHGVQYQEGLSVAQNGANPEINVSEGILRDEDIVINITDGAGSGLFEQVLSPLEAPVMYLDGANAYVRSAFNGTSNTYGWLEDGSGNPVWNEESGGTWQQTTVPNNNYFAMWLVASHETDYPVWWLMGQGTPSNKLQTAIDNNNIRSVSWTDMPFEEFKIIARVIFKRTGANVTLQQEWIDDFRMNPLNPVAGVATSHAALSDLSTSGHPASVISFETVSLTSADSPYTILSTDSVLVCDCSGGAITLNLPSATGNDGRMLIIKKTDSSANVVTITPDGSDTCDVASVDNQDDSIAIVCDEPNTNWVLTADHTQEFASDVTTDTSNFDAILSAADDTVQKALDTLDDNAVDVHGDTMQGDLDFDLNNIMNVRESDSYTYLYPTDDWTTIVNSAADGTIFFFTPGTYTYSGTWTLTDRDLIFIGAGDETVIQITPSSGSDPAIRLTGSGFHYTYWRDIVFTPVNADSGVLIDGTYTGVRFFRCRFKRSGTVNYALKASNINVSEIYFIECQVDSGFTNYGWYTGQSRASVVIMNCKISSPFYVWSKGIIVGNTVLCGNNFAYEGNYDLRPHIVGNMFYANTTDYLLKVRLGCVVTGNSFVNANTSSTNPLVYFSTYNWEREKSTFSGNYVFGNTSAELLWCYGPCTITGNVLRAQGNSKVLKAWSNYWTAGWYPWLLFDGNDVQLYNITSTSSMLWIQRNARVQITGNYIRAFRVITPGSVDVTVIDIDNPDYVNIIGNTFEAEDIDQSSTYGEIYRAIDIQGTVEERRVKISDNHFIRCPYQNTSGAAIYLSGVAQPIVTNNKITAPEGYAIYLDSGCDDPTVDNNHIIALELDTMQDGIYIAEGTNGSVRGNYVKWKTGEDAIYVADSATCQNMIVKENRYNGNLQVPTDGTNGCIVYDQMSII